jgi:branched-chain amino acid transport system substrate-binding protein
MRKAMEKADFKSVRGNFKFNNNHLPIQNFYLEEARKDDDGTYSLHTLSVIVKDDQDAYHGQCPMK